MGAAVPVLVDLWGGGHAQPYLDRQTGLTGSTINLTYTPILSPDEVLPTPFQLFKNGVLLDPTAGNDYTIAGTVITLAVAAVSGDKFEAAYWYRVN
ncbi:MAG TPA: hypothetical protein VEU74_12140 [Gemmatimonadales bacterium]|nr:hypothetical protein [Gemmatimonadales bacterium]